MTAFLWKLVLLQDSTADRDPKSGVDKQMRRIIRYSTPDANSQSLERSRDHRRIPEETSDPQSLSRTVSETELVRGNPLIPGDGMRNAYLLQQREEGIEPSREELPDVTQIRGIHEREIATERSRSHSQSIRHQPPVKRKV